MGVRVDEAWHQRRSWRKGYRSRRNRRVEPVERANRLDFSISFEDSLVFNQYAFANIKDVIRNEHRRAVILCAHSGTCQEENCNSEEILRISACQCVSVCVSACQCVGMNHLGWQARLKGLSVVTGKRQADSGCDYRRPRRTLLRHN